MAEEISDSQQWNFGAISLEALFRIMRSKGFNGDRRRFLRYGRKIVEAMRERGELPAE